MNTPRLNESIPSPVSHEHQEQLSFHVEGAMRPNTTRGYACQDRFWTNADAQAMLVADGSGGNASGDRAAQAAKDLFTRVLVSDYPSLHALREALEGAYRQLQHTLGDIARIGSGGHIGNLEAIPMTTLIAGKVLQEPSGTKYLAVAWVGDSRVYSFDGESMIRVGESKSHAPLAEGLSFLKVPLTKARKVVFATDGLELLEEDEVAHLLKEGKTAQDLLDRADQIVKTAEARGEEVADDDLAVTILAATPSSRK